MSESWRHRFCCNDECGWVGETDRMCGAVGPLCPDCGEVTQLTEEAFTVYIYRQPDGTTQVRALFDNEALVMDMLTEALRAMSEGDPVVTQ